MFAVEAIKPPTFTYEPGPKKIPAGLTRIICPVAVKRPKICDTPLDPLIRLSVTPPTGC